MDLDAALDFARAHRNGILITLRGNGRPQSSNVVFAVDDADVVRVSITADRAKYKNLRRDQRVALHVNRDDFWAYVVLEGDADLGPVAKRPGDAACDELVELYRSLSGEHPDWDDYRAAMVRDQRCVLRLRPQRAYGMLAAS